jgi:trimeric autotransporter adhesin
MTGARRAPQGKTWLSQWRDCSRLRAVLAAVLAGQMVIGPLAGPVAAADHDGVVRFGGLPLPGASVTATQGPLRRAAVTGPDGTYRFTDLADGSWTLETSMMLFTPQTKQVTPPAPAEWDLVPLADEQLKAAAVTPPREVTVATGPRPAVAAPKPGAARTNTATPFQRTDVTAAARTNDSAPTEATPAQDSAELRQRAADGLLLNGSVNNGAASPFSQSQAFGNNRRGLRSLYNGNIGLNVRNSALDARSYSLTGQNTPKPGYSQMQGVFAFGGPFRIPKLVRNGPNFSVQYQWARNTNARVGTGLMPTADQRNGILSDRIIAPADISPQSRAFLRLYPLPNFTGNTRYNFQVPLVGGQHQDDLQARSNRSFNRGRDQFQWQLGWQSSRTDTTNLFGFLDLGRGSGINTSAGWRHSFSPRFYINSTYQFSRQSTQTIPFFSNRFNFSGAAGITGNNQDPLYWGPPSLTFAGGISALSSGVPQNNRNQTSGVQLDLFYNRGRHNWTGGGGLQRQQSNILSQQDPRGTFTFTGVGSGSDFANFLVGKPDASSIAFGNADKYLRATNSNLWVQDDWRLSPGLTLNLGVRWEYWGPTSERYGRLVNLALSPNFDQATPVISGSPIRPDRNNIAPRLSFSWRPLAASSMIVRGSYGLYFDTSVYQPIVTQMAQQAPLSKSLRIANTPESPITLADGFSYTGTTTATTFAVDPKFRLGYSQNWSLSVQRDLPWALQMVATYSGVKGTRAMQQILPNTFPLGAADPCPLCPSGFTYLTSNGNSLRNAGDVQVRRRLRAGLTASLTYTYAKSMDNAILGGRGVSAAGGYTAQNWRDLGAERSRSVFDQRHAVAATFQYTTGMGLRGALANNWKGKALRDWTVSTQVNTGTGLPLSPVYLAASAGSGVTGTIRPDVTGADVYAAPSGLNLNPAAFRAPQPGQWGNALRNSITGPSQFSMNAAMNRSFQLRDRISLDFRLDVTNVLNTPVFPSWNTTINSAQFGLPGAANAMRSVQTGVRARF